MKSWHRQRGGNVFRFLFQHAKKPDRLYPVKIDPFDYVLLVKKKEDMIYLPGTPKIRYQYLQELQ